MAVGERFERFLAFVEVLNGECPQYRGPSMFKLALPGGDFRLLNLI
jgi:hypothetical protein